VVINIIRDMVRSDSYRGVATAGQTKQFHLNRGKLWQERDDRAAIVDITAWNYSVGKVPVNEGA
jgi:hypothetical protein